MVRLNGIEIKQKGGCRYGSTLPTKFGQKNSEHTKKECQK